MGLRDRAAGELSAPVVVVALGAGEIELALAAEERVAAGLEERPGARVDRDMDRQGARLPRGGRGGRGRGPSLLGGGRGGLAPRPGGGDGAVGVSRRPGRRGERRGG